MLLLASFTWETPRMSINLIESEHRTQRSVRSTFVSVAVHACLITLAVYATATVAEAHKPVEYVDVFPMPPTAPAPTTEHASHGSSPRDPHRAATLPHEQISISITVPKTLPPIDFSTPSIEDAALFGSPARGATGISVAGTGGDAGEPLFAAQVEKPAIPRNGNPSPKYPSLLESSRVEGTVLVQFVVDTLGVADMSTFKVLDASNDLFAESTRATLSNWRFYPAEAGGKKVKEIVQLPLRFVAPRR
jgi:protein TonB